MSDLQKNWAKSILARLPPEAPLIEDEPDEADDNVEDLPLTTRTSEDDSSSASSTGTIKPAPTQIQFPKRNPAALNGRLSPLEWTNFFEHEFFFPRSSDRSSIVHHAYLQSPQRSEASGNLGPLFVTHHGAGSSGSSFSVLSTEIRKILPHAGLLSLDARGHGDTNWENLDNGLERQAYDLSLGTLGDDLKFVLDETGRTLGWSKLPDIVLVGHSLGGAVITDVAKRGLIGNSLLGYAVLDVVEGSALDALQSMETYLSTRPSGFPSMASGIEWHTRSRTIRDTTSARASVPSLLKEAPANIDSKYPWIWRTDLAATKPFWEHWFSGLSSKFLEARGGKLLLLAGTDRLDKELMIGQMQGKYQLQVFPDAGHFIHEDQPRKTAQVLADFYTRNNRVSTLPPKVGDMLKAGKKSIA